MKFSATKLSKTISAAILGAGLLVSSAGTGFAQEMLPKDNGIYTYHTAPRYRETESHPLRLFAYVLHPIGWVLRETITRPISYFAGSSETTASVMGFREPFDYREPECFSADSSVPDCRSIAPFNYDTAVEVVDSDPASVSSTTSVNQQVYIPDVNFDFDKRAMNELGTGKAHQIARLLEQNPGVNIVLEGHADYKGSPEYNEKLGMDRADAVKKELIALGVPADKVSTVTFGKSKPVFEDQTDWARAVNRRVEVRLEPSAPVAAVPEVAAE